MSELHSEQPELERTVLTFLNGVAGELRSRIAFWLRKNRLPADLLTDIEQEAVIRFRYKIAPTTEDSNRWKGALFKTAQRLAIDERRKRPWEQIEFQEAIRGENAWATRRADLVEAMNEAIGRLDPREKHIIELFLSGMTDSEIAKARGIKDETVRSVRRRVVAKLRTALGLK